MAVSTSRSHPTHELAGGLAAVPTSLTAVTTVDTFLEQLHVANTAGTATTLKVVDGSSNQLIPTVSLAANTSATYSWPALVKCAGGVSWQASQAGLTAELFGYIIE